VVVPMVYSFLIREDNKKVKFQPPLNQQGTLGG